MDHVGLQAVRLQKDDFFFFKGGGRTWVYTENGDEGISCNPQKGGKKLHKKKRKKKKNPRTSPWRRRANKQN